MTFYVREEQVDAACDEATAMLNLTRPGRSFDRRRYDWLYRENPDGEGVVWLARQAETGQCVGLAGVLPRRMIVDGAERVCWNCADLSVHPSFRRLGLAVKLRRRAKEAVDEGRVDFLYGHPNWRAAGAYEKVGHIALGKMVRLAKPLSAAPYMSRKLGNNAAARALGSVLDVTLRFHGRQWRHRTKRDIHLVRPAQFDERFDDLFEKAAARSQIVGVRDSRYLNWRYAQNPVYHTHALEAREGKHLCGYLLFMVDGGVGHIKDVFPPGDSVTARDLICHMITEGHRLGLHSLSAITLEENPLNRHFAEFGFCKRPDRSRMFVYAPSTRPGYDALTEHQSWFLTVGDRDV